MSCDIGKATEGLELCSFSNPPVTSPTSQLILQPFRRFTYVTVHSPTLPLLHLRHNLFSNPSAALPTSQLIFQPFRCFPLSRKISLGLLFVPFCWKTEIYFQFSSDAGYHQYEASQLTREIVIHVTTSVRRQAKLRYQKCFDLQSQRVNINHRFHECSKTISLFTSIVLHLIDFLALPL